MTAKHPALRRRFRLSGPQFSPVAARLRPPRRLAAVLVLISAGLLGGAGLQNTALATKPDVPLEVGLHSAAIDGSGGWGELVIEVRTRTAASGASLRFETSAGLALDLAKSMENMDLQPGKPRLVRVPVKVEEEGVFPLTIWLEQRIGPWHMGKSLHLYLERKAGQGAVLLEDPRAALAGPRCLAQSTRQLPFDGVGVYPDKRSPAVAAPAPSASSAVISGAWAYLDKALATQPLASARVEIRTTGGDLLDTVYTDANGRFTSHPIEVGSGRALHATVYSTDDLSVHVQTPQDEIYTAQTEEATVQAGAHDLGVYAITDNLTRPAFFVFDKIANEAYWFLYEQAGWQNNKNIEVVWSSGNLDGTYYLPGGGIHLLGEDRWDSDVLLHEFSHFVMDSIYIARPPAPFCNPHWWGETSSLGCAWVEGWATFLQGAIQGRPSYDDTEDQILHIDLETPDPRAEYAEDEGAVCASLWDIFDDAGEPWDTLHLGLADIWNTVKARSPKDVLEFDNFWLQSSLGFNTEVNRIMGHHLVLPYLQECTTVVKGTPLTKLSQSEANAFQYFCIEVPPGATGLSIATGGGSGDLTLKVKQGLQPTMNDYDYRSATDGTTSESVVVSAPSPGVWYIGLQASPGYSGAALTVDYTPGAAATTLYAAHVADTPLWWSRLSIANAGNQTSNVMVTVNSNTGKMVESKNLDPLPAFGAASIDLGDLFVSLTTEDAWLKISSSGPVKGVLEFGTKTLPTHVSLPLTTAGATEFYFPYVITGMGYYTGITLINPSAKAVHATLYGHDENSFYINMRQETIPAGGKYVRLIDSVFTPAEAASVRLVHVVADGPLLGFELFGNLSLPGFAGLPAVAPPADSASGHSLVYNDIPFPLTYYTGMTCSNVGNQPAAIHTRLFAADGAVLAEQNLGSSVSPYQQVTRSAWVFTGAAPREDAAYVEATSTQAMLGFSLFLHGFADPATFLFDGFPATAEAAATLRFPVLKTGAEWGFNRLCLTNRDDRANTVSIRFYNAGGTLVRTLPGTIPPRGRWAQSLGATEFAGAAWFSVESAYPVIGSLFYVSANADRAGAYLGIP